MTPLVQFLFNLLYTRCARSYDTVASLASMGAWRTWGATALAWLPEGAVLELAHGPGHLLRQMREGGRAAAGIDVSAQMTRLAAERLALAGFDNSVARATAEALPFADHSFAAAVATFPAPFIFSARTLAEVRRVLRPAGALVIVAHADLVGRTPVAVLLRLAYAATGQRAAPLDAVRTRLGQAGFRLEPQIVPSRHARVHVWVCRTIDHP